MKVAVFGKPGGGKSTLSQQIASVTNLPLHQLDLVQFAEGGAKVPDEIFAKRHSEILANPRWVVDGFGTPGSFEDLLRAADVLVYVERAPVGSPRTRRDMRALDHAVDRVEQFSTRSYRASNARLRRRNGSRFDRNAWPRSNFFHAARNPPRSLSLLGGEHEKVGFDRWPVGI